VICINIAIFAAVFTVRSLPARLRFMLLETVSRIAPTVPGYMSTSSG
jgi:hypothetical protein